MHYLTLLAFNSVHGVACVLCPPCNELDATNFDFESIGNRIGNRLLRRGYCITFVAESGSSRHRTHLLFRCCCSCCCCIVMLQDAEL